MDNSGKHTSGYATDGVLGLAIAVSGSLIIAAASFTPWAVVIVSLS